MNQRAVPYAVGIALAVLLLLFKFRSAEPAADHGKIVVRISHFRPSIPATVQKARGNLEKKLATAGATVQWTEFKVTPDSALAASSGAIDVMVGGVEGSLSTLALGVPAQLLATGPHQAPKTGWFTALLVRDDSPIRSLGDLKGKKIATGRGGFSEAVLALAVRAGGFKYPDDVEPVFLSSADARNAFAQGLVDAVLTLDPYVVQIQRDLPSRILTDNEQLGYPTIWAVLVLDHFAVKHPDLVDLIAGEFAGVGPWIAEHPSEVAGSLATIAGFDQAAWETTVGRASYLLEPLSAATIPDVQYVADRIFDLGVIRSKVDVASHVWTPRSAP